VILVSQVGNKLTPAGSKYEIYQLAIQRCVVMKVVAAVMVLFGIVLGYGAVMEFRYFGPDASQFWAGVFTTPASLYFTIAGILLWRRGAAARGIVLTAGLAMAAATIGATVLRVMGPPATLMGIIGALVAIGWALKARRLAATS
jgi:hypothetical protein